MLKPAQSDECYSDCRVLLVISCPVLLLCADLQDAYAVYDGQACAWHRCVTFAAGHYS